MKLEGKFVTFVQGFINSYRDLVYAAQESMKTTSRSVFACINGRYNYF